MGKIDGSIPIVQTYPQGRSIRACILSTIREIFSANASPLQKRDALKIDSAIASFLAMTSLAEPSCAINCQLSTVNRKLFAAFTLTVAPAANTAVLFKTFAVFADSRIGYQM